MTEQNLVSPTSDDDRLLSDLSALLNTHSRENVSNTPDFILASVMMDALTAFECNSLRREGWYGKHLSILGNVDVADTKTERAMQSKRVAKPNLTKPPAVRITEGAGGGVIISDVRPKKDKTRFADCYLIRGDEITLTLGEATLYCYTIRPWDSYRHRAVLRSLQNLTERRFVSKRRLRQVVDAMEKRTR